MKLKCMRCDRREAKFVWTYEGVCSHCWKALVPEHWKMSFRSHNKLHHRILKSELQYGMITEGYWAIGDDGIIDAEPIAHPTPTSTADAANP